MNVMNCEVLRESRGGYEQPWHAIIKQVDNGGNPEFDDTSQPKNINLICVVLIQFSYAGSPRVGHFFQVSPARSVIMSRRARGFPRPVLEKLMIRAEIRFFEEILKNFCLTLVIVVFNNQARHKKTQGQEEAKKKT